MKKISLLFAIVIMSVLFMVSANALDTAGQCGDNIYWDFDSATGTLTLNGNGEMYDYSHAYNTPWYENGYAPYIKKAIVEEGITSLGGGAFANCYRMETVSLPESLKELGLATFATCCSLTEIDLPENLEKIGIACFGACYGLKEITIPEKIKEIPDECFSGCFNLKSIVFPDGLEKIGDKAFEGCYDLPELTLGRNVTHLGYRAFRMCAVLKDVYILNPELDLTKELNYIGKMVLLLDDEYDRVEFFDRYGDVYSELVMYIADDTFDIKNIDALEGEEKVRFESLQNEYNVLTKKINHLQQNIGSTDKNYVISDILTIHGYKDSTAEAYANELGITFKALDAHTCTFGEWYTVTEATVFAEGLERRDCEDSSCNKFETRATAKLENAVAKDESTKVEITYTDENFDKAVDIVVTEDKTTANIVLADEYENFKAYDISLLADGNKVQPNGKVAVKLPLPVGYNVASIAVYYISDSGEKTIIDSKVENGFVIFETNHFSVYAIVDESSKIEKPAEPEKPTEPAPDEPTEPETPDEPCFCKCHKGGISGFFWKIANFFNKLFKIKSKQMCTCGIAHY